MYEQSMVERGWAGADPEGVVYIGGAAGIRGGLGGGGHGWNIGLCYKEFEGSQNPPLRV